MSLKARPAGTVERTNRTYRSKFYDCYDGPLDLLTLQAALADFEQTDAEEGDGLKSYIYKAREEGSRPADRP